MTCNAPLVITGLLAHGLPTAGAPIIAQAFYDLETAALMVGRSKQAIRLILSRRPDLFDQPHYTRRGPKRIEYRLVTAKDIGALRQLFPIYVKPNLPVS